MQALRSTSGTKGLISVFRAARDLRGIVSMYSRTNILADPRKPYASQPHRNENTPSDTCTTHALDSRTQGLCVLILMSQMVGDMRSAAAFEASTVKYGQTLACHMQRCRPFTPARGEACTTRSTVVWHHRSAASAPRHTTHDGHWRSERKCDHEARAAGSPAGHTARLSLYRDSQRSASASPACTGACRARDLLARAVARS